MNYAEQITKELSEAVEQLSLETQIEMLKEENRALQRKVKAKDCEIEKVQRVRDYYHERADYLDGLVDKYIERLGHKITE